MEAAPANLVDHWLAQYGYFVLGLLGKPRLARADTYKERAMRELLIALCLIVSIPAHAGCKDISDPRTCDEEGLDEWYPDRDKRSSLQRLKDSSKEFIHEQAQKGRFERCMEDYKDEGYCGQFRD